MRLYVTDYTPLHPRFVVNSGLVTIISQELHSWVSAKHLFLCSVRVPLEVHQVVFVGFHCHAHLHVCSRNFFIVTP